MDSLVCAYGRYDINKKNAKQAGCGDEMKKLGKKITKTLLADFDMTGEEALALYQTEDRDEYTVMLHEKLQALNME